MERQSNNLLQAAKQIQALYGSNLNSKIYANQSDIFILKRAMATMQHHDAVTGTEKQNVAEDYAKSLYEGAKAVQSFMGPILFEMSGTTPPMGASNFLCPLANVSQCSWTESESNLSIVIYNPLNRKVSKMVRLPVKDAKVQIFDGQGNEIETEFVPVGNHILSLPGRQSEAYFDVIFRAENIPALGYRSYFWKWSEETFVDKILEVKTNSDMSNIFASMAYYIGSGEEPQPSGAYVFRPENQIKTFSEIKESYEVKGNLVEEYWVFTENDWMSFVQRQYKGTQFYSAL